MKTGPLKIYIDRLKDDDTENIFEVLPPNYLDVDGKDLKFPDDITISGQAYLAKSHLILELKIKTKAKMPCSICNEDAEVPIDFEDFYHTIELCEISSSVYDFSEEVRSAILLKVPQFMECQHGHRPKRKDIKKYLTKDSDDTHSPFSDLEID